MAVALGIAAAVHAALLFGLGSPFPSLTAPRPVLEVMLAAHSVEALPAASADAEAGALASEAAAPDAPPAATRAAARPLAPAPRPVAIVSHAVADAAAPPAPTANGAQAERGDVASPATTPTMADPPAAQARRHSLAAPPHRPYAGLVRDVAKLAAPAAPGAGPRVRRLDATAPRTNEDAYYLAAWRREVERVGHLNYPEAARTRKLRGNLRLLVAIAADGSLHDVRVLESSGHAVLDAAAVRIVRLAAPYAPLPPAMRRDADVLEIVRTWQFQRRRRLSNAGGAGPWPKAEVATQLSGSHPRRQCSLPA